MVNEGVGRLLIVDDEVNVARVLGSFFTRSGWEVRVHNSPAAALDDSFSGEADVVLTDLSMPEMTGVELMQRLQDRTPPGANPAPVLLITAYGTIDNAVQALKQGAFDYLTKPFDLEKVKAAVQRAYLKRQVANPAAAPAATTAVPRAKLGTMIGAGAAMQEIYRSIERAAKSRANVLILGESGTGKELVARALHQTGPRSARRFVAVSCAALPSELLESELFGHEKGSFTGAANQRIGRFELADGGTLFLDEIGDISLGVQAKLMRVLQEREVDRVGGQKPIKVDVRLVAATNRDLVEAIGKSEFREDLYYRLRVVVIQMPTLRDRKEDIPLLATHFLDKFAKRDGRSFTGLTSGAMEMLEAHSWPGNVRELENAIEHSVALAADEVREIGTELLPPHVTGRDAIQFQRAPLPAALDETERRMVLAALEESQWDLSRAAVALGVTQGRLRHSIRRHHLSGDRRGFSVV